MFRLPNIFKSIFKFTDFFLSFAHSNLLLSPVTDFFHFWLLYFSNLEIRFDSFYNFSIFVRYVIILLLIFKKILLPS